MGRSILDIIGQNPLVGFLCRALRYILTCGPKVLTFLTKKTALLAEPTSHKFLHKFLWSAICFGNPLLSDLFGDLVTVIQSHDKQLLQRLQLPVVGLLLNPGDLKSPGKSRRQYPIRRRHQRWLISPLQDPPSERPSEEKKKKKIVKYCWYDYNNILGHINTSGMMPIKPMLRA